MYVGNIGENNHLRIENVARYIMLPAPSWATLPPPATTRSWSPALGRCSPRPAGKFTSGYAEGSNAMYVSNARSPSRPCRYSLCWHIVFAQLSGGHRRRPGAIPPRNHCYLGSPSYSGHHNAAIGVRHRLGLEQHTYPIYVVTKASAIHHGRQRRQSVHTHSLCGYSASASNNTVNVIGPGAMLQVSGRRTLETTVRPQATAVA